MALDVPYTIQLAKAVSDFNVLWIEEPVPPDQIDSYRRIKDAVPDMLIPAGEREFTRYEFRDLIEKKAGRNPATGCLPGGRHLGIEEDRRHGWRLRATCYPTRRRCFHIALCVIDEQLP